MCVGYLKECENKYNNRKFNDFHNSLVISIVGISLLIKYCNA